MASSAASKTASATTATTTTTGFQSVVRSTAQMSEACSPRSSRSHLAPEDAFDMPASPPRRTTAMDNDSTLGVESLASTARRLAPKLAEDKGRSRRRKRTWRKLLWVKQSYPDNYTDQATFLENLQRNPRLQPYEFWPLVADSTVILQQVCSVTIFVVCFVGIFQERVSPVAVVGWGSFATFLGWLIWDWWVGQEGEDEVLQRQNSNRRSAANDRHPHLHSRRSSAVPSVSAASSTTNLGMPDRSSSQMNLAALRHPFHSPSVVSLQSTTSASQSGSGNANLPPRISSESADDSPYSHHRRQSSSQFQSLSASSPTPPAALDGRTNLRLSTVKSAILIYFTLLGLSPILKSLTRSTSSDSIWAMSFWLLAINIFFYDYSGGVGVKFPASLSTNAALMASTVLASRLPSTGQVFSLTLFSIEVFGLFPVFRRYARHRSWRYHVALSTALVVGAGGGVGMILGGGAEATDGYPWRSGLIGALVAVLAAVATMGGCSWWLIGLQKYKNDINGPWDQARPIIISRRLWEDA